MKEEPYTKYSTRVFKPDDFSELDVETDSRLVEIKYFINHRHFSVDQNFEPDDLKRMIDHIREQNGFVEADGSLINRRARNRWSRSMKVNIKRQTIASYLESGTQYSMKQIARFCSCDQSTVKSVSQQLQIRGRLIPYEYNNLHQEHNLTQLRTVIDNPGLIFYSVSQIKKLQPMFSKKRITRELIDRGKKWRKMKKVPQPCKREGPDHREIYRVINNVVIGLWKDNKEILFVDEFKLPLNQTPTHCWGRGDQDDPRFNGRFDNITITGIVMCSVSEFKFVQLYIDEVTSKDFLYFVQECIDKLPTNKAYSIVLDNASWHKSELVRNSDVYRFFCFNVPGVFQLNMIENSFSGVRNDFRHRTVSDSLVQEIKEIANLFLPDVSRKRFVGYYKNYLRSLIKYLLSDEF